MHFYLKFVNNNHIGIIVVGLNSNYRYVSKKSRESWLAIVVVPDSSDSCQIVGAGRMWAPAESGTKTPVWRIRFHFLFAEPSRLCELDSTAYSQSSYSHLPLRLAHIGPSWKLPMPAMHSPKTYIKAWLSYLFI